MTYKRRRSPGPVDPKRLTPAQRRILATLAEPGSFGNRAEIHVVDLSPRFNTGRAINSTGAVCRRLEAAGLIEHVRGRLYGHNDNVWRITDAGLDTIPPAGAPYIEGVAMLLHPAGGHPGVAADIRGTTRHELLNAAHAASGPTRYVAWIDIGGRTAWNNRQGWLERDGWLDRLEAAVRDYRERYSAAIPDPWQSS